MNDVNADGSTPKLLGGNRVKLLVASGAILVLLLGAFTRPRTDAPAPLTAPSEEKVAPLLEAELASRREPAPLDRSRQVAATAVGFGVAIDASGAHSERRTRSDAAAPITAPSRSTGVIVGTGGAVLTHVATLQGRTTVSIEGPDGSPHDATAVAFDPATGLVLLRTTAAVQWTAPELSSMAPAAGELVTAAGRVPGGQYVAPVSVVATRPSAGTMELSQAVPTGTPLYDQNGALLALSVPDRIAVLVRPGLARLSALETSGHGIPSSIGIALQSIDPSLTPFFTRGGVIVSDVAEAGPAAVAGIAPGDVVTSIGGAPVADVDTGIRLIQEAQAGRALTIETVRTGRPRTANVMPEQALATYGSPAAITASPRGPVLRDVLSPEQLQMLEANATARLLAIDGRTVSGSQDATRLLRRVRRGALLYIANGRERLFVAMPGAQP